MEVDAFGRTRPAMSSHGGGRRESVSPPEDRHRAASPERGPAGRRRRTASFSPPRGPPGRSRDSSPRDRDRGRDRLDGALVPSTVRRRPRPMPPMLSFRNFTRRQSYDAPPEVFQRRYDEYQIQYAHDVSDHFFDTHKFDEWFLDRYDPLHMQSREEGVRRWALEESAAMGHAARAAPLSFLQGCSLEPGATPQEDGAELADAGRHVRGHADRSLYLNGIPASCPREDFVRAVNEALAGEDVTVDRVLVAQPSWRKRELAMSFDRQAWVLLAAGADMKAALRALKEHRFTCPGPVDTATGLPIKGFTFRVSAAKHMPRGGTPLPAYMSAPRRVAADTWRALRIAHLLDTERDIPAESRLSYLLSPRTSTALVLQMRSPADVLDTAIAYLRRVHFVAYYAGLRFHDEAHLLSMPSEFVRSEAYCLPPPPPPSAGPGALVAVESEVTEGAAATAAAPPDLKAVSEDGSAGDSRKRRRDSDAEEGDEDAAQGRRGKRSRSEDSADGHVSESAGGDLSAGIDEAGEEAVSESSSGLTAEQREATEKIEAWKRVVKAVRGRIGSAQIDRRLDAIKDDLAARLRRTAKGAAASADDADAKSIQRLHDELLDGFVKENCTVQEDGRARCGLESCGKLFKDAEFLEKHIRSKHIALARVRLVDRSVEFTRSRFEADSLGYRPLPLVNVEVSGGVERRSVKEIVDSAHAGLLSLGALDGDRRASRDADRRISGPRPPPPAGPVAPALGSQPPLPSGAAPEPARKISYYVDVDEPKESVPMDLDYGVAVLPPPRKKKRSLGGIGAPAVKPASEGNA